MVHPDSSGLPRDPPYLGNDQRRVVRFRLRGFHPLRRDFPVPLQLTSTFVTPPHVRDRARPFPRPRTNNPHEVSRSFGLGIIPVRSPLLGKSRLLSFPRGTEMFHSPRSASAGYEFTGRILEYYPQRVVPFGHPRIKAYLAAPRGLSQPVASFIASWCQNIHQTPFVA
jgi:hypothetical protein